MQPTKPRKESERKISYDESPKSGLQYDIHHLYLQYVKVGREKKKGLQVGSTKNDPCCPANCVCCALLQKSLNDSYVIFDSINGCPVDHDKDHRQWAPTISRKSPSSKDKGSFQDSGW